MMTLFRKRTKRERTCSIMQGVKRLTRGRIEEIKERGLRAEVQGQIHRAPSAGAYAQVGRGVENQGLRQRTRYHGP